VSIRVLFCIIRFHVKENRLVLFPEGARPHPVTVSNSTSTRTPDQTRVRVGACGDKV